LRRSTVEAVAFHVQPNPDLAVEFSPSEPDTVATEAEGTGSSLSKRAIALAFGALLLLALAFWLARRFGPRLLERLAEWRREREESEGAYFSRFRRACSSNDPRAAMQALLAWLDRTRRPGTAGTVAAFVDAADDPALAEATRALFQLLYGEPVGDGRARWSGADLHRAVRRHRRFRIAASPVHRGGALAPLNLRG
jgi:hypothetical protein